ncbi:MAG: PAS domain-containing protein [Acidobacteria bacterium]|nr:PAS domain-containing protein [Acidobacteriota bacterium]
MTRSRTFRLSLCLLLAVATVVLGALSVRRKIASFQPLGFAAAQTGGIVRVDEVETPSAGVKTGDEILLVDGGEIGGTEALGQRLRARATAELAVLRGGQVVRVAYHRPPLSPDVPYLILVFIGAAYLLIGLYTLTRQQSREGFLFCLWCLTSALLYLLTPVPPVDAEYRLAYLGDQLARIFLPAMTLHLFLIFPASPARVPFGSQTAAGDASRRGHGGAVPGPRRRLIAFFYLPGAVLLALQLDLMIANGRWLFGGHPTGAALRALDRLDLLHLVSFSLAAVAVLCYRALRERGWEPRRQMHWMIFGLAGGYLPFLVFYVIPFVLGAHPPDLLAAVAVLPLALVPLTFAYAILRYKLWDIEVIARDIVSATLTLLLGVFGFSLVNLAITRGISPELPLARNLLSFAAGLGIAGLLVPTRHTLSAAIERLQYRGTFGKRRALLGLGRDLLHERDLGRLCGALLDRLAAGMDLERVGIYLAQGDNLVVIDMVDTHDAAASVTPAPTPLGAAAAGTPGGREAAPFDPGAHARPLLPAGARAPHRRTLAAPPPVVPTALLEPAVWRENVYRLAGTELPAGAPSPLQQLFIAGYRYAFPLTVRGRAVGMVLSGWKRDQTPLNSEDLDLIRHLLNQAALAIENAQLLGQLHLQLAEVQRLQRFSDGIFESSPAGIAVLDSRRRLVSANPAFAALVERDPGQLIGHAIEEVLPVSPLPSPGEGPIEVSYLARPASLGDAAAPRERFLQLSLAEVAQLGEVAPGRGTHRDPLCILVVYDVSERVAMERSLKEKDRLAALGMLAAGVAHEVNTPITGISSYAQMLLSDTAESDPRYTLLKKVERQTFRAARIVNNLIEFARERQRERRPVAVLPLLRECVELVGDRLERGKIELRWELPAGADSLQVLGADGELEQVFINLLANALDAMSGQPGGRLDIAVAASAGGDEVTIRVKDSGPGIPPEQLATVFQPFYSTKLHRGGTGLGLTISHEIVQRHGGRLLAFSTPGHGACFTVELPRLPAPPDRS